MLRTPTLRGKQGAWWRRALEDDAAAGADAPLHGGVALAGLGVGLSETLATARALAEAGLLGFLGGVGQEDLATGVHTFPDPNLECLDVHKELLVDGHIIRPLKPTETPRLRGRHDAELEPAARVWSSDRAQRCPCRARKPMDDRVVRSAHSPIIAAKCARA